ncbi:loricrin-like [Paramacrobiotus metropolitanus]|uniref:loricrin-like n=1 Tax=Paramacrobiotus metropolitanus TaxID=2943436 RepID=UPI002445696B|nr:loricrin-like [Paramacrobiotus metropolitanus]
MGGCCTCFGSNENPKKKYFYPQRQYPANDADYTATTTYMDNGQAWVDHGDSTKTGGNYSETATATETYVRDDPGCTSGDTGGISGGTGDSGCCDTGGGGGGDSGGGCDSGGGGGD